MPAAAGKRSKKAADGSDAEDSDQECTAGGGSRHRAAAEDEDSDSDREVRLVPQCSTAQVVLAAGLSWLSRLGLARPCKAPSCPTGRVNPDTTPPTWPSSVCCSVQDVDWEANPAAGIFSRCDDSFLVARRGLMLTEYGKVDACKAKARLLHGGLSGARTSLLLSRCMVCCAMRIQRAQTTVWHTASAGLGSNMPPFQLL